ncbi:MAG: cobalamin B12-binding domain-containing protein, partial [Bacteroidota bacterium]|nr:cobalamin B12-binding domain-containing protein [Bacteroidota bacterium]
MNSTNQDKIRIVTAASLFDGHDAAINIMRRILQSKGAEIIHLGHNRSVREIVECAIEEDAQGIAITSYQGGHVEFFKYMKDLLDENRCGHIKIFGGGGGTILPQEIKELHDYGITRIYSPDDGRKMGLEGMIQDVLDHITPNGKTEEGSEFWLSSKGWNGKLPLGEEKDIRRIARAITLAEAGKEYVSVLELNGSVKSGKPVENLKSGTNEKVSPLPRKLEGVFPVL